MIDWERLKAVYLDNSAGSECTAWALYDAFPAILAQHEADQATIAALHQSRQDAARYQALKSLNGRIQWWEEKDGIRTGLEVWSDDFGGLDAALDFVIAAKP